jgi:hypothetical protein
MAYYENLPIYRKAVELAVLLENTVRGFPRYHKYAIGADMRHLAGSIAALIIKANSERDKVRTLTELRDKCEEMKFVVVGRTRFVSDNFRKRIIRTSRCSVRPTKKMAALVR